MYQKAKVESVKAQGDGVINTPSGRLFVPFTIEGEEIEYSKIEKDRAKLIRVITPSSYRVSPACPYFASCGGCKFQHLKEDYYLKLKKQTLLNTLSQRGIEVKDIEVKDIISVSSSARRRATFCSIGKSFGFNSYKSKKVISISSCLVLSPAINKLLPYLKEFFQNINGDIFITESETGFDVLLIAKEYPKLTFLEKLGEFASSHNIARIAFKYEGKGDNILAEPLIQLFEPTVKFKDVSVPLPIGSFLQPSKEGEEVLSSLVLKSLEGGNFQPKRILDLFCGLGSFTIPLARTFPEAKITGIDIFAPAISSLNSVRVNNIDAKIRNLYESPLSLEELSSFDAIVIDPPRSGAFEQIKILSASDIKRIVYVSCNPATFARDAEVLLKSGYQINSIIPVDQFVFSHHLELACLFCK